MNMTVRRPSTSARTPVNGEASRAKNDVDDVMSDLSRVVRERWESEESMEIRVEDITPVLRRESQYIVLLSEIAASKQGKPRRTQMRYFDILISEQQSRHARADRQAPYKSSRRHQRALIYLHILLFVFMLSIVRELAGVGDERFGSSVGHAKKLYIILLSQSVEGEASVRSE
jgi:hypothetical protein